MAEWIVEQGIGEDRAILVEDGRLVAATIELPGAVRSGAVMPARLIAILIKGRRGIVTLPDGSEALLEPCPAALTEGAAVTVEIVRAALPEHGRPKRARARLAEGLPREAPGLFARLAAEGATIARHDGPDLFERHGWSELLDEAMSGEIAFDGGALRISLTPAMTLIDVDGTLAPEALAIAGAGAAGTAIARLDIGGSIGIDLPTLPAKADRLRAAAALDAALPPPFERTAVNGFGFLQIVRRRKRPSIAEIVRQDPMAAAARALLRLAERTPGTGMRTLRAAPAICALIADNPDWLETLARRLGAPAALRPEPGLAISAGHVHADFA